MSRSLPWDDQQQKGSKPGAGRPDTIDLSSDFLYILHPTSENFFPYIVSVIHKLLQGIQYCVYF